MCYWSSEDESYSSFGRCSFRPIQEDLIRVATVALISAVVSAPFSLTMQYIISNILSKETSQREDKDIEASQINPSSEKMSRKVRKSAMLISGRKERCGDSVTSDLHNLLNEAQEYRQRISGEERHIFDGEFLSPSLVSASLV
jgi:hypothetical protein